LSLCRERFTEFLLTRQAGQGKGKAKGKGSQAVRHSDIKASRHPGIRAGHFSCQDNKDKDPEEEQTMALGPIKSRHHNFSQPETLKWRDSA